VSLEKSVENLCDATFVLAGSPGRLPNQLRQRLGSWSGHVQSWLDGSGLAIHPLRYEDLLQDTAGVFAEVVRFCGLPLKRIACERRSLFLSSVN
jgi:hypothetical protein